MIFPSLEAETAWLAGIFEGEGCASSRDRSKLRFSLEIMMTDKDIIDEVARIAGVGTVTVLQHKELRSDGTPRKLCWRWRAGSHRDFQTIVERLYPYLGSRRRAKIEEIYREAPWIPEPYFFEEETDGHRATPTDLQTNLPLVLGTIRD